MGRGASVTVGGDSTTNTDNQTLEVDVMNTFVLVGAIFLLGMTIAVFLTELIRDEGLGPYPPT